MTSTKSILLISLLLTSSLSCHGYNILVLGVHPFHSHLFMLSTMANELVNRGHNVTFVTVKANKPHPKLHVIQNENVVSPILSPSFLNKLHSAKPTELMTALFSIGIEGADKVLASGAIQQLIHAPPDAPKYDAVLTETYFLAEVLAAGFSHKYSCPLINYQPVVMSPNVAYMVDNPYNPAYIADYKMHFTSNMTFWQRLENSYFTLYAILYQSLIYYPAADQLLRKYFPASASGPYISDLLRQHQAFTLVDTHPVLTGSIALAPNVIDVGGMQIQPPLLLPADIADFMTSHSRHGVIYFAMGSHINAANLGPRRIDSLIKFFATLRHQGVLWKLDTPELSTRVSANVKIATWFPQNDILAHPHCRLFITHGGVHSTVESLYHGVPMLILPLFADQMQNGQKALELGYGEPLDFDRFSYDELEDKVNRILREPSFRATAQRISAIMKSEPVHPLQRAMLSIEYVISHQGATHLRSAATHLAWYQLYLLDVIFFFLLVLGLVVYALYRVGMTLKRWVSCLCGQSNSQSARLRKNNIKESKKLK